MDKQTLIIYKFQSLYEIFKELEINLNFNIFEASNETNLHSVVKNLKNYLIISKKKINDIDNQFVLNKTPIKLSNFIEKLNIEFIKLQFSEKSEFNIGSYKIDLNSRYLIQNNKKLKLTEKESDIIIYLSKSNSPVGIDQLQFNVWGFNSKLETHTVETHIYRLRKKMSETFDDDNFILSLKNGYKIN